MSRKLPPLKMFHTSDWHIGRTLYGRKRYEEFEAFLTWLAETIQQNGLPRSNYRVSLKIKQRQLQAFTLQLIAATWRFRIHGGPLLTKKPKQGSEYQTQWE